MSRTYLIVVHAWLAVLTLTLVLGLVRVPAHLKLESLEVGRLDVVEPDGKPRVILANAARFPGVIWDGKEYPHPGRDKGGILFFDDDGTEAGGMIYTDDPRNKRAGAILTFDQYRQDETLALMYDEEGGKRAAGLAVADQPDRPLLPVILANNDLEHAKNDADRVRLKAALEASATAMGPGEQRLYAGKREDGSSGVWLYDPQGRPRARLVVASDGAPSLELLDAAGQVVARMPETTAAQLDRSCTAPAK